MKTKILLLISCLILSLSTANAKFEPINKDDPEDPFLIFADFGKATVIPNTATRKVILPLKSNPVDKETQQIIQSNISLKGNFYQLWTTMDYVFDCVTLEKYSQNWQVMGKKTKSSPVTNFSKVYRLNHNPPPARKMNKHDVADVLIYQKICNAHFSPAE